MGDRFFDRALALTILAILIFAVYQITQPFISSILWGTILAIASWPLLEMIQRRSGGRRWPAATFMTLLLVVIVGLPIVLLATSLVDQVSSVADLVDGFSKLPPPPPPDWLASVPLAGPWLDGRWRSAISDFGGTLAQVRPWIAGTLQWLLGKGVGLLGALGEMLLAMLVTSILFFQGGSAAHIVRRFAIRLGGQGNGYLLDVAVQTIRAVAVGVVGTALVQGVLASIGFAVSGVPGAMLLGFLVFVGAIAQLPAGLLMVPMAIWLHLQGNTSWAIFLGAYGVLFVGTVDNIIRPLLIGRGNSLPMLLILVGVMGGLLAYGFVGIFLGATLLAVVYTMLMAWLDNRAVGPEDSAVEPKG